MKIEGGVWFSNMYIGHMVFQQMLSCILDVPTQGEVTRFGQGLQGLPGNELSQSVFQQMLHWYSVSSGICCKQYQWQ